MTKPTLKEIGLIFLGILLGLIILELVLRIIGFGFIALQWYGNRLTGETKNVYSILALGESTTTNLRNGQSSWPEQLEIILNNRSKNIKFKVFNEGIIGTTTSKILLNLESNLDKYRPDMVITMMGTNDKGLDVPFEDVLTKKQQFSFKDFRVYKLTKRITEGLKDKMTENDYEKENRLKKAVEADPNNIDLLLQLSHFYEERKNYKEEINIGKKLIELQPNNYNTYFYLGKVYMELEKYEEAEEMLNKSISIYPNDPYVYVDLGNLYRRLNRSREGIDMYRKYITIKKGFDQNILFQFANLYLKVNDTKSAYEIYKLIVFLDPTREEEVYLIGKIYQELNKSDDALRFFNLVIEKNPNNFAAFTELRRYYLENNMSKEADKMLSNLTVLLGPKRDEMFKKAMEFNPSSLIRIYDNLGVHYQKEKQFEKAQEMFNKASKLRRDYYNPSTQDNYQQLYRRVNRRGIKLIVMQYPTLNVDELKTMFSGDEEIIFVSNEDNFKKVLANSSYEEYFVDRVREIFGHATKKGNQLIAENVANEVLNVVEK